MLKKPINTNSIPLLIALLLMTLILVLVAWRMQPPAAKWLDAPADEFSAGRAMSILQQLLAEEEPHPVGSENNERVAQRIMTELKSFGYEVQTQEAEACEEKIAICLPIKNIMAELPAEQDNPAVMLSAHYDSVPNGPGVADDGAGVAAILEVARLLKKEGPFRNPVIILITDGEEAGLLGADAFVSEHPWASRVAVVINLEARGTSGPSLMFETSENNAWLIEAYANAVPQPVTNSLLFEIYRSLPNDTDLTVFKQSGMAGFNFAFIENEAYYHTPQDNLVNLDLRSLQHHGDNTLSLARTLADMDLNNPPAGNAVYMDLLGLTVIQWPESWTIPLAVLVLLLLITITINLIRRSRNTRSNDPRATTVFTTKALLWGLLAWFNSIVIAILLGLALTSLIGALAGTETPWYAYPLPVRVALSAGVLFTSGLIATDFSGRAGFWGLTLGTWLSWAILSLLLAIFLAGAAILFLVPTLVAALTLGIAEQLNSRRQQNNPQRANAIDYTAIILPALTAALVWIPIASLLESALGIETSPVITLPLALIANTLAPLFAHASKKTRSAFLASATTLIIIGASFAILTPVDSEMNPEALMIMHGEERN